MVTISSSAGGKIALGSTWESVHHVSKDYENRTLEMGPEMLAQNSHNTIRRAKLPVLGLCLDFVGEVA